MINGTPITIPMMLMVNAMPKKNVTRAPMSQEVLIRILET